MYNHEVSFIVYKSREQALKILVIQMQNENIELRFLSRDTWETLK